jgi:hypothetical protein
VRARRVEPIESETVAGATVRWDYADAFEVTPADARTAEQWARATLEDGPRALALFVMLGWRWVLRLRLGPGDAPDHVAGWPIVLRAPDVVVLEVESGVLGRARLTFRTRAEVAGAASNVAYEQRGARALWWAAGLLHRRILPYLLGHAASAPPRQPA